jgi:hypothetical protein
MELILIKLKSMMFCMFLKFYYYYNVVWEYIFSWLGELMFIFYIDHDDNIKNITWNYYLNCNMSSFDHGVYYLKIYNTDGTNHLAFSGNISDIEKKNNLIITKPKRKHIILLNNSEPINVDLKILDNYKLSSEPFPNPIKNMDKVLKLLGIKCSQIVIININPFFKTILNIEDITIDELYH